MITCPKCGKEHDDAVTLCTCGHLLLDPNHIIATRALDDTDQQDPDDTFGSAQFTMRTRLVLSVEDKPRSFEFPAAKIEQIVIGRTDPRTGFLPEVNLAPFDAGEKGVSRKHAAIVLSNRALRLIDLQSANGTFVNGNRLSPDKPRILRDGDEIRLGLLVIHVTFEAVR